MSVQSKLQCNCTNYHRSDYWDPRLSGGPLHNNAAPGANKGVEDILQLFLQFSRRILLIESVYYTY